MPNILLPVFFPDAGGSSKLWEVTPFLKGFQLTYRLSLFCAFFSSAIAAIVISQIKNRKIIYILISAVILITILNWGNRKNIPQITDRVLTQELFESAKVQGNGTTIWTNADKLPKREMDLITNSGVAEFSEISRNSTVHRYLINVVSTDAGFTENTLFFPAGRRK